MENQNPHQDPITPDYQFITDQQSPDVARKPHAKKVYVLFGSIVVLIVAAGLSLIFGATNKNVSTTNTTQSQAEETVQSYLQRIAAGSDTEAFQMIEQQHRPSQKFFTDGTSRPLRERYVLDQCTYADNDKSGSSVFTVNATCPVKDSTVKFVFEFRVIATDTPRIVSMKAVEKI